MFVLFLLLILVAVILLIVNYLMSKKSFENITELLKIEHHWKVHGNCDRFPVVQNEYG